MPWRAGAHHAAREAWKVSAGGTGPIQTNLVQDRHDATRRNPRSSDDDSTSQSQFQSSLVQSRVTGSPWSLECRCLQVQARRHHRRSTPNPNTMDGKTIRLRASCNACNESKVRCSQHKPTCARCERNGADW
ncbi:hypothetical protein B0T26DRAFT_699193 [Lasiosphaeria miniovina]|uniref:Zn(2)-C6 fungal-type domain-containing protein n=1 Tax=Lasiosphaeria miniovina TaxID=1954250 RepID=A0AA40B6Y9_9PEZI|nr:uncharacterized protein B0T26DRAFT_699193 [Lasiosphaeria miniovina]KAK0728739.1 hypothetical protein B0T26DRAFT_699193 [Lasiosphaeria miniovina]